MPSYSDERRQAVMAKLLSPYNQSVEAVARQEGISSETIYKWRKEARAEGRCLPDARDQGTEGWSSRDKFAAVVETPLHFGAYIIFSMILYLHSEVFYWQKLLFSGQFSMKHS
ncbi:hypothetical protein DN062_09765 [Nitrincola tibetensis]|uniref:Transposase n=1 Tax=Nitrincola tibetensis TaxID=2219697 RepID=A0A364NLW8_9GAMM|nr:transposase [Nitrincola tibetensis]RAU18062.1 hypothetical protein DN062_09765 [Nitrincola tibetensis]